jgi:hypothetical protein
MPKVKELEPMVANGAAHGYRPRQTTRRIVATPEAVRNPVLTYLVEQLTPAEEAEPFWAEVRDDLTFAEIDRLPLSGSFSDLWEVMAPWVIAWNATARDEITGAWVTVEPPASVGTDAFATQRRQVTQFLAYCLKLGEGSVELPKGRMPANGTRDG